MIKQQQTLAFSEYADLYDKIVPKDNLLRQIHDLVDFSFVHEELAEKYSMDWGRGAIDPARMFKYLLLKVLFDASDVDVVERSRYDMSFKYFLGMTPEEDVINPSSLTKFRKLRLKDSNLLDLLINHTVGIALEQGLITRRAILVDATHTKARYNQQTPRERLVKCSKELRKSVYEVNEQYRERFPAKVNNGLLEDEIEYCQRLMTVIKQDEKVARIPKVREKLNLLQELVTEDLEQLALEQGPDPDARKGHKTADTSFFGYKTHLAMTEERIITAAVVTSGEKHDGKQLPELIQKSRAAGINVNEVIADGAYAEKENLKMASAENIRLIAKLSPTVTHGNRRKDRRFEYNKDAGMYVCPAGHMSNRKTSSRPRKHLKDGEGSVESYFFDVSLCRQCPQKTGCYKDGAATKSYSVSIRSNTHQAQMDFMSTEYFKTRSKERYMIEAKNSELKHRHGYDVASSSGLCGMQMQGAMTIFAVNLKRILTLMDAKHKE